MTNPGKMMQDSVSRLADAIAASKHAATAVKESVAAQEVPTVPIGQEGGDGLDHTSAHPA